VATASIRWDLGLGSIQTRNAAGIVANFVAADRTAQDAIRRAVKASGFRVQSSAKRNAPVRSGRLRRLIKLRFSEGKLSYTVGWIEEDFTREGKPFYPLYVEFGTSRMAARPTLFPASQEERPKLASELSTLLRAALARLRPGA
jgi:HK97 gp10 family phage protein